MGTGLQTGLCSILSIPPGVPTKYCGAWQADTAPFPDPLMAELWNMNLVLPGESSCHHLESTVRWVIFPPCLSSAGKQGDKTLNSPASVIQQPVNHFLEGPLQWREDHPYPA